MTDPASLPTVDRSTPGFVMNPRADAYLKLAAERKKSGDLPGAIESLELAEVAMSEGEGGFRAYSVSTLCRLPLYLQQAGRGQEAIDKLIKLLDLYPPSWGKKLKRDRTGLFLSHLENQRGTTYDKLRLVLQREKRFAEAVPYGVMAETYSRRIDTRIYEYVAKKWDGKGEPESPGLLAIKAAGGTTKDYQAACAAQSEWYELKRLKEQYPDPDETPQLDSVAKLLKKLKRTDLLPALQGYAKKLVHDFKKPDAEAIADVQGVLRGEG